MSQGLEMTSTRGLQKSYSHKSKAPVIIFTGAIESFTLYSAGNFSSLNPKYALSNQLWPETSAKSATSLPFSISLRGAMLKFPNSLILLHFQASLRIPMHNPG
jgi:hypothetical protein